jgi:hypothetical protein
MGKYSEALRKIEEERKKSEPSASKKPVSNAKPYITGILLFLVFISAAVYGYGLRHGARLSKESALKDQMSSNQEGAEPVRIDEGEDLLQNIEKMLILSYDEDAVNDQAVPRAQQAQKADYYTVQLVAYQEEIRARQEVQKLVQGGLDVFVLDSGQFYVVCSGRFSSRDQATDWLFTLKNSTFQNGLYQDAFIRLVKLKE